MIYTILVYLTGITLLNILFKSKSNTLNCGIMAWSGKNPKKFDKFKFNILGIYNEKRGVDSCGIAIDGEISVGTDKTKVFRDFISEVGYDSPELYPQVIGHTRWATIGVHDVHNAHPFGFGTHNDKYKFIGVHNGSLLNHKDLAKKRNIKTERSIKVNTFTNKRDIIDSEILLNCIYFDKNFSVLSEYTGAAALVFSDLTKPNVVYYYHGKSKLYPLSSKAEEERPLYYYIETRNSLYVSSIKESLFAIGGTDDNVFQFEHNTVYEVTDGDISKAKKTVIDREDMYQKVGTYGVQQEIDYTQFSNYNKKVKKSNIHEYPSQAYSIDKGAINIYNDKVDRLSNKSRIYFERLRYWRNGHLLKGGFCFIKDFGFYFLGEDVRDAEQTFWHITNKHFYKNEFIDKNNKNIKDSIIPFIHNNKIEITSPPIFYFYDGVMVKDVLDYKSCIKYEKDESIFPWESLSCCAVHPIIDICKQIRPTASQNILLDNEPFTGNICPLLSENIYFIKDGNLRLSQPRKDKKKEKEDSSKTKVISITGRDSIFNTIEEEINNVENSNFKKVIQINNIKLEAELEDKIDSIFTSPYKQFPILLKELDKFKDLPQAKEAQSILEDFINKTSKLITLEVKE